jgi:5-methylcytosine-specific restriction protein A
MRITIPKNITKEHIIRALQEIDKSAYPKEHESTKFDLIYNGERYPPKYVIRTANIYANGVPFETDYFSGGNESNKFLKKLGFSIKEKSAVDFINPLKPGDTLTNTELRNLFRCGLQGGMRRSKNTNSLILISDPTKMVYKDRWVDNIFFYTGMGLKGDQTLDFQQNKTLLNSRTNGVSLFLFEVFEKGKYSYSGEVELARNPITELQPDIDKNVRKVFVFPLKLKELREPIPIKHELLENIEEEVKKKVRKLSLEELELKAQFSRKDIGKREVIINQLERDPIIAELAKRKAKGKCQLCEQLAPFKNTNGEPYLEAHHIEWLSKGGKNAIDNTVALCPNCHAKMHVLNLGQDVALLKSKSGLK